MYRDDLSPLFYNLAFHYIVPHESSGPNDTSPFHLLSLGLYDTRVAFEQIARSPRDAVELVIPPLQMARLRMTDGRGYFVLPIDLEHFASALGYMTNALVIVISCTPEIAVHTTPLVAQHPSPVLHITSLATLTRAHLRGYCLDMSRHWATHSAFESHAVALRDAFADWTDPFTISHADLDDANHFVTGPNVATLASIGRTPREWDGTPLVAHDNAPYFVAIKASVDAVLQARNDVIEANPDLYGLGPTDLIITSPAAVKHAIEMVRARKSAASSPEEQLAGDIAMEVLTRHTYGNRIREDQLPAIQNSGLVYGLLYAQRSDMAVYTAMLSVRASSDLAPAIRLPPGVNRIRTELHNLAGCARADSPHRQHKLCRLARRLSESMKRACPDWLDGIVSDSRRIKLISDAPLEWLEFNGLPLMLQSDVSRIPVTPGNLFVQTTLRHREIAVPLDAFNNILILRSFQQGDRLQPLLEESLDLMRAAVDDYPDYHIVDVHTKDDVVKALDSFDGLIVIYDGHGAHDSASDLGHLALSKEHLNPWELRGITRVPPIVLLSACDTHPFDASHNTVANGFLNAGAATVLATSVPIQAIEGSVLIARLLLRIEQFLPLLIKHRPWKSFRWSEVLPGLQRRQFTTEAIRRLQRLRIIDVKQDELTQLFVDVGMAIDTGGDWFDLLVNGLGDFSTDPRTDIREAVSKHTWFVDALAYVQLGNPELIVGTSIATEMRSEPN